MALRGNVVANVANLGLNSVIAVVSIPILTAALGVDQYAAWLVASSIPALLVVSDFGLGAAGSVRMTQLVSQGRVPQAKALLRGYGIAAFGIVGSLVVLAQFAVARTEVAALQNAGLNLLLATWVLSALISTLIEGAFRAFDEFAIGISFLIGIRSIETLGLWAAAVGTADLVVMAIAQLVLRVLGGAVMAAAFIRRRRSRSSAWLTNHSTDWFEIRSLWKPSLGFLAGPSGQILLVQGSTLIAAANFSSAGLVLFNSTRVVAGLVRQVGQTLCFAVMPEITRATTVRDFGRRAQLVRKLIVMLTVTVAPAVVAIVILGPWVLRRATNSDVGGLRWIVALLLVYAVGEVIWSAFLMLHMASNAHLRPALAQLVVAIVTVVAAVTVAGRGPVAIAGCFAWYGLALSALGWLLRRLGSGHR